MTALFQGVPLRSASGAVIATVAATSPDHYANGLPYEVDGSLCFETGAITHYHQGLPLTANDRVAVAATAPVRYNSGAMPIASNGTLSVALAGGVDHYSSGVGYTSGGSVDYETSLVIRNAITTEGGDALITEGGDNLVTE
jgi:hypothetical protein